MAWTVELVGGTAVIARFGKLATTVHGEMERTVRGLTEALWAHVKTDKLQGQVLRHITGKLSNSIETAIEDNPDSIVGRVFSNGTAPYAHRFEYGYQGPEAVKSFQRRQTQAFGRPIDPITVTVAAFTRQANQPARSFLRSSLKDMAGQIEKALIDAVARAAGAST